MDKQAVIMNELEGAANTVGALKQQQDEMRQLLEGVRQAFAEKGFDGASMLDLARACGMSVGNF